MALPPPRPLGHGIHVVPVPLPFGSPAWVNCYVISGATGSVLVDCGVEWEEGHEALTSGLKALGLRTGSIQRLVVSHLHPDHVGMAPRLSDEWDVPIVMHRTAAERVPRYNDSAGFAARLRALAVRHGVPPREFAAFGDVGRRPSFMPTMDVPDTLVDDGDHITVDGERHLAVLHTPGHETGHICLRDSRTGIVFSGDHVLGRITPVIMYDEAGVDVLGLYLGSLQRFRDLDIGLTYPAHGGIVEHGALRAEQIMLHHDRRLDGMLGVVRAAPSTGWEVMIGSYRPNLSVVDQRLALRETVAHLEHLRTAGRVISFSEGERWYYRTAP